MSEKRKLNFELSSQQLKVKTLLNKEFIQTEVWAISDAYPNRNNSHFTLESIQDALTTVVNKPVLGAFGIKGKPDFHAHDGELSFDPEMNAPFWDYENGERVLGMVRESDKISIKQKDGLNWLVFNCCLWTYYNYKAVKNVLKNKTKKVSVEVEVLDSYVDERGIEVITKFNFLAVSILGNDVSEGIPNAHMSILEKMENSMFNKQVACLNFAYDKMENEPKEEQVGRTIAEIFGYSQSSDKEVESNDSSNINENKEEITMIEEGGIVGMQLTYEQKRDLIESYLRENLKEQSENEECVCYYIYISDLDDTLVYFNYNDVFYSAPYAIIETEEKNEVSVDLEQKERVVRSWQKFEENDDDEDGEDEKDDSEKELEVQNEEPEVEKQAEENSVNEKQEESENIPEDAQDEKAEECNFSAENQPTSVDVGSDEPANEIVQFVKVNDEDVDINTLLEKFTAVSSELEAQKNAYEELNTKFTALQADMTSRNHKEMETYAENMINEEDGLDESDASVKASMFEAVKTNIEENKFTSMDEVQNFVTSQLAMALYNKKQANKVNNSQKEFSVTIPSVAHEATKIKTDAELLKEASLKLENI